MVEDSVRVTEVKTIGQRVSNVLKRATIEDGTGAKTCQVVCLISDSLASIHPLKDEDVGDALARRINQWPSGHRLDALAAFVASGGEYRIEGSIDLGLRARDVLPSRT